MTVVPPWTKASMRRCGTAARRIASSTPTLRSETVVRVFSTRSSPVSRSYQARSVNVPPMSIASRATPGSDAIDRAGGRRRYQAVLGVAMDQRGIPLGRRAEPASPTGDDDQAVALAQGRARQPSGAGDPSLPDELHVVRGAVRAAREPPRSSARAAEAGVGQRVLGKDLVVAYDAEAAAPPAVADAVRGVQLVAPDPERQAGLQQLDRVVVGIAVGRRDQGARPVPLRVTAPAP